MGNQLIREQLFEILHNRKRMPGERFGDIEGKIEEFFNQEVEKRIAERMPNLDDLDERLTEYLVGILDSVDAHEWLRSRLTNPNNNPK